MYRPHSPVLHLRLRVALQQLVERFERTVRHDLVLENTEPVDCFLEFLDGFVFLDLRETCEVLIPREGEVCDDSAREVGDGDC